MARILLVSFWMSAAPGLGPETISMCSAEWLTCLLPSVTIKIHRLATLLLHFGKNLATGCSH